MGRGSHRKIWRVNKDNERARTGGDVEEERVGGRGHVLPEGGPQKSPTGADGTRQSLTYWWCGTAAQEGEGRQSVGGRV